MESNIILNTVLLLTKVTFTYSEVEDRILMSAKLSEGDAVVFWLTLRLCSRLVIELTGHLERSASRPVYIDTGLLLTCHQHVAEWQHVPSEPVSFCKGALQVLPVKVALSCSSKGAVLLFSLRDGQDAQLPMNLQQLRQWLAIVHRQYKHAGWPMDVWPEWFVKAESGRN